MNYAAYPEYKDSEVEWLGDVPFHWLRSKLGFESIVKARLGWKGLKADEYVEEGFIFLATPNIKNTNIDFVNVNRITYDRYVESPEIMLQKNDVLVAKDGSTTGTTNIIRSLPEPATVNSSIAVIRPLSKVHGLYLFYFFLSKFVQSTIKRVQDGMGVPHLFQADLRWFDILLPPRDEQSTIAAFLDHETAKIDRLIAKQEELIVLLKEKRQAVISHAVTKGLNPDAPMKDSGVVWLGEVPAHWEVKRLRYILPEITVGIVVEPSKYYASEGIPALRSLNVKPDSISTKNLVYISRESNAFLKKSCLKAGDLVAVRSGQPGTTAIIPKELDGCNCIDLIILRKPLIGSEKYLCYYLNSEAATHQFTEGSGGAIQQHFNISTAMDLIVCFPPPQEQYSIAFFVSDESVKFEKTIDSALELVELLQERRSALISAAVTGKIDVRDWKPTDNITQTAAEAN